MGVELLLREMLTTARIRTPLRGSDKDAILRELVMLLADDGVFTEVDAVLAAVRAREAVLSTGIGSGVAVPHGRTVHVSSLVMAAGVVEPPVEFAALDGRPVELVFLLVAPEGEATAHVKALSRIARLVRHDQVRARLLGAANAAEFQARVAEAEEG